MRSLPLVSIIMPCYNSKDYLKRSLGSVLSQTYSNIELILVDDGSNDNTLEIAKSYIPKFSDKGYEINIIQQTNQGPGYAAINGLEKAKGEFVSYLDSDDMLLPQSVEVRATILIDNPQCNCSRTNGYKVFESNLDGKDLIVVNDEEKYSKNMFEDLVLGKANNFPGTFMVRTSALQSYYKDKSILKSDFGQNLQMLMPGTWKSESIYVDRPLMKYIMRQGSHSRPKSVEEKLRLSHGYYQIRSQMLDVLDYDFTDLKHQMEIVFTRIWISIVLQYPFKEDEKDKQKKLYHKYYNHLKSIGGLNLEYRTANAAFEHSKYLIYYRILYKMFRYCSLNLAEFFAKR